MTCLDCGEDLDDFAEHQCELRIWASCPWARKITPFKSDDGAARPSYPRYWSWYRAALKGSRRVPR